MIGYTRQKWFVCSHRPKRREKKFQNESRERKRSQTVSTTKRDRNEIKRKRIKSVTTTAPASQELEEFSSIFTYRARSMHSAILYFLTVLVRFGSILFSVLYLCFSLCLPLALSRFCFLFIDFNLWTVWISYIGYRVCIEFKCFPRMWHTQRCPYKWAYE